MPGPGAPRLTGLLMESDAIAQEALIVSTEGQGTRVVPVDAAPCDHVIPIRPGDLTRQLTAEPGLAPDESAQLERFGRLIAAVFHHEYHSWLQELKDLYAPLDPDSDCVCVRAGTFEHTEEIDETFLKMFEMAMIRANYRRLDLAVIEEAIEAPNELGLNYVPNFDLFEHMKYLRPRPDRGRPHGPQRPDRSSASARSSTTPTSAS